MKFGEFARVSIRRQGFMLGTYTCANCTAGFYCAAGSLNVLGGTDITGAHSVLVAKKMFSLTLTGVISIEDE